jgi:hypothetical protein
VTCARARAGCGAQGLAEHVGRDRVAATVMPAVVAAGRDPVPNCRFAAARGMQGLAKLVAGDPAAAQVGGRGGKGWVKRLAAGGINGWLCRQGR